MSFADMEYRPVQDGLRATGRYLDENARRMVSLLVVEEGVVVTLTPWDIHAAGEAVLLSHDDLKELTAQARTARGGGNAPRSPDAIFPTGYEDFLRALGAVAAEQNWPWLRVVRMGEITVLRYGNRSDRREIVLKKEDVENLLNHAFSRRGQSVAT